MQTDYTALYVVIGVVGFLGTALSWGQYHNHYGIYHTRYWIVVSIVKWVLIAMFVGGGLTGATLVGFVITVLLWTASFFVFGLLGALGLLGWFYNLFVSE